MFSTASNLSLSSARSNQSMPSHPISFECMLSESLSPWHGAFSGCRWTREPPDMEVRYIYNYYYYRYSALGPLWAETRAQSGDWYGSGMLHPGQVLRGSLPLLSPAFRRSHFHHQMSPHPSRRERS